MSDSSGSTFVTTRWTQVLAARGDSEQARQALSDLCAAYYAPVVAFLRTETRDPDQARELAHEFFARVLERQSLQGADPERGRFRSYLLGALKHFLANRRLRDSRQKRGGHAVHESLSHETGTDIDAAAAPVPADSTRLTLERVFDREWALNILDRTLAALRKEASASNTLDQFETLKSWLPGETASQTMVDTARRLDISEGAVRVAIHRLRRRFRDLVKAEIAQTVESAGEIDDELRHLIEVLS